MAKPTDRTDQDHIDAVLIKFEKGKVDRKAAAVELLQILIRISGERLLAIDKARHDTYHYLLTNGMIKPEYQKAVYTRMHEIGERVNGK